MTRLAFGLIAVAFVASASQAGPLGFLKNLRQRPQGNTQAPAQAAAPAQPAPVATSEAAPAANPALNRLTNNRVTRYFTKPAANPN